MYIFEFIYLFIYFVDLKYILMIKATILLYF